MTITELIEHEDGSATIHVELEADEVRNLINIAFTEIIRAYLPEDEDET